MFICPTDGTVAKGGGTCPVCGFGMQDVSLVQHEMNEVHLGLEVYYPTIQDEVRRRIKRCSSCIKEGSDNIRLGHYNPAANCFRRGMENVLHAFALIAGANEGTFEAWMSSNSFQKRTRDRASQGDSRPVDPFRIKEVTLKKAKANELIDFLCAIGLLAPYEDALEEVRASGNAGSHHNDDVTKSAALSAKKHVCALNDYLRYWDKALSEGGEEGKRLWLTAAKAKFAAYGYRLSYLDACRRFLGSKVNKLDSIITNKQAYIERCQSRNDYNAAALACNELIGQREELDRLALEMRLTDQRSALVKRERFRLQMLFDEAGYRAYVDQLNKARIAREKAAEIEAQQMRKKKTYTGVAVFVVCIGILGYFALMYFGLI